MRVPAPIARSLMSATAGLFTPGAVPVGLQRTCLDLVASGLPGPAVSRVTEGGIAGEQHVYGRARALLYLHGGGYSIGSPRTHRRVVARLAHLLRAEAFVPAYRLAPEHPYPAALEDTIAAYTSLTARFAEIVVAGDSAGGGLALALAIHARDANLPAPAVLGLICPWLDLVGPHESTGDPLITPARLERWKHAYAPDDLGHVGASPVRGELSNLPPIVVHSAERDPLRADVERLVARVSVEHRSYPGTFHAFHALAGITAEADDALAALAASILAATTTSKQPGPEVRRIPA